MSQFSQSVVLRTFILFFFTSLVFACDERKAKAVVDRNSTLEITPSPSAKAVNEELRILYASVSDLAALNGKTTFRFYVDANRNYTLHGWKNANLDPPDIKLNTSFLSGIFLGPGVYQGNLIVKQSQLNDVIRDANSQHALFIRFIPMIDNRPGSVGQVIYRMVPSIMLLTTFMGTAADSSLNKTDTTGYGYVALYDNLLNPSPPRADQ